MEIKQQLRLSQQLVMTPQLQQAIRLLQLSRLELIDEIRKELDANPVLADEEVDPRARANGDAKTSEPAIMEPRAPDAPGLSSEKADIADLGKRNEDKQIQEIDWEQFLENRTLQQALPSNRGGFEELPPIEQNLTKTQSLVDHLRWQLQMSDFTEDEKKFAELVLGNLDDNGFLDLKGTERSEGEKTPDLTIEDMAREIPLDVEDAECVLREMQEWDPVGVCSRSLQECLRVQAEVFGCDDLELSIIDKHLSNLEKHNYQAIARDLKVTVEEIYEAVKQIQKLESRPARNFSDTDDKTIAITPDVYVIKDGDKFVVSDNDRGVQRLYINEALTKQMLKDVRAKEFIGEKLRNAQWLIRAIEQRRKTIIRVTECIVEKQRDFFEKGVAYLKPMILRDVAETVGMHESTISRVTTNKYVHTPQGLFELKYFFNSSIRRMADDDIASESVKQAIKKIIEGEDKGNPLSDQQIVELLAKRDGIQIARRTVAKYREMLGILSSSKRKKLF
ncbi:MAG TPA: RNA polymerase factor sigma-54 [Polyangiaceae bacterium]|jgi:RNA polymerase sigma-54 factor|nr:RNA polymerase factor sigma-54 [Polyangiaceae bacterium]